MTNFGAHIEGIDLSFYQPDVSFAHVAATEKCHFVFIRTSEGNTIRDAEFAKAWKSSDRLSFVRKDGQERDVHRGPYHFGQPNELPHDAYDEAMRSLYMISRAGGLRDRDLPPVIDLETLRNIRVGPPFLNWFFEWCDTVESQVGRIAICYAGKFFFNQADGDPSIEVMQRVARHPLWLPAYVKNPDLYVPDAWKSQGFKWDFWQRSGDIAASGETPYRIDGVKGVVDRNVFAGDARALSAFVASTNVGKTAVEGYDWRARMRLLYDDENWRAELPRE